MCSPLGLFGPICGGHLLLHLSFHEWFYHVYKNSPMGLEGAHLLICYCRTRLLLRSRFLHLQCPLLFALIAGLLNEGHGTLLSSHRDCCDQCSGG
jgi:hypothetical protein